MARFEIKMPKLGESITEGTILSWSVQVGDVVNEDDVLFEVNTAKVSAEIPSPVAGKVVEILFKEGDTVPVGTVVAIVDMDGEGSGEASETAGSVETASAPKAAEVSDTASVPKVQAEVAAPKVERWYSPAVLQLAREAKISQEELDSIPGTGYEGRLSKKDIRTYIEMKKGAPAADVSTTVVSTVLANNSGSSPVPSAEVQKKAAAAAPQAQHGQSASAVSSDASVEVKEMDRVRRIIADHMVMSKKVSPHVTNVVEVDVTRLVRWREKTKDAFLFCCYAGLRYSDFTNLSPENIVKMHQETWLIYKSVKTNTEVRLPLYLLFEGKGIEVLNKYQDDLADFFKLRDNSNVNKELLIIAKLSGLNKRISFHTARHTNATLLIYSGVNITTVQKLLGHKSVKTTQVYTNIMDITIVRDLEKSKNNRKVSYM